MATCKDCLHYEACKKFNKIRTNVINDSERGAENLCEIYADKSRFIELPCKVGDTVYEICNNTDACHNCQYYSEFYGMDELCDKFGDFLTCPTVSDEPLCEKQFYEIISHTPILEWIFGYRHRFGKTVFLTREEAEAALAERMKE